MSGVKGRSGRVSNLESRLRKSNSAASSHGAPAPYPDVEAAAAAMREQAGDPGALLTLPEHDSLLGKPQTWGDALKRLQLVEQDRINEKRSLEVEKAQAELDLARGRMIPREELDRSIARVRDAWWVNASQIVNLSLARLSSLSMADREKVKAAVEEEVLAAALRVKKEMTTA